MMLLQVVSLVPVVAQPGDAAAGSEAAACTPQGPCCPAEGQPQGQGCTPQQSGLQEQQQGGTCKRFSHYVATLEDGSVIEAKRVIVAIGSTNIANMPPWAAHLSLSALSTQGMQQPEKGLLPVGAVLHAWQIAKVFSGCAEGQQHQAGKHCSGSSRHGAGNGGCGKRSGASGITAASSCSSGDNSTSSSTAWHCGTCCDAEAARKGSSSGSGSSAHCSHPGTPTSSSGADTCFLSSSSSCGEEGSTQSSPRASSPGSGNSASLAFQPISHTCLTGSRVVVVGGGLTSAQLTLLALSHGCTDVVLMLRSSLRVRLRPGFVSARSSTRVAMPVAPGASQQ